MRFLQGNGDVPARRFANNRGKGKLLAWLKDHVSHPSDECLIWTHCRDNQGYGVLGYFGKSKRAHYIMCMLAHGEPPTPKHQAAHSCNNGHLGCVNARHLDWKTPKENAQDRIKAGNSPPAGVPRCKLTEDKVKEILRLKGQETITETAERFGVSFSTISSIHCGRVWRKVTNYAQPN